MTTATAAPATARPFSTGGRVLAAARLSTAATRSRVGGGWLILAAIFVVHQALWWVIRANHAGAEGFTGALTSFFIIVGISYLVVMTQVMPFALSLGLTRRHFYLGTSLLVAVETLVSAVALTVLLAVERATAGWGLQVQFFEMGFLGQTNPFLQVLAYWVPLLTVAFVFLAVGAVFRRWGALGVWVVALGALTVVAAGAMYLTWQNAWSAVGRFFVETPTLALLAGYPLVLAVVAVVGGYLVVRRALP